MGWGSARMPVTPQPWPHTAILAFPIPESPQPWRASLSVYRTIFRQSASGAIVEHCPDQLFGRDDFQDLAGDRRNGHAAARRLGAQPKHNRVVELTTVGAVLGVSVSG
jgi:hypothetical protein